MQVTETLKDGLKRSYTITVPAAVLDAKVSDKLAEAQPEIEMKGFRKGKVPMPILRKQFGERLLGDAMQDAIDGAMKKHFDETGDRPALQPKVEMKGGEAWKQGDDVVVEMSYEALPAIPEVDLSGIKLEKLVVKADDKAIEEALDNLAGSAKAFEDRKKGSKAKEGDQVVIDFVGKIDGEPFEGGAGEDYPLELGSGSFIPGFEDQLVGAKAGDEVAVKVSFPADYGAKHLAGKEAVFDCTVKAVKAPKAAEIDDELAKRFGAESLEALRGQIAERLEAEYAGAARQVMKRALLDALDGLVSFDLPPSLVDAEAHQIAHQLWHDEHPEEHGHNHGSIEPSEDHNKLAERRVRLGLLLAEIGRKEKVEVTDAEMTQAVLQQARQYPGQERAFFDFVQKNPQMQQQLRAPIFEDKVVDLVFAAAKVTEKDVSKDKLQKAVEALDEI
ncbi:trigger factor [Albidovulum sp.]|uniref:trigger factor n=1 Tax=Albidovulum sp. TaxID=1872424 RepID=UPI0039B90310